MTRSYVQISPNGVPGTKTNVLPLILKEGIRLSCVPDFSATFYGRTDWGHLHIDRKGCKCIVSTSQCHSNDENAQYLYHYEVVGTDPESVEDNVDFIEHLLGARNLVVIERHSADRMKNFLNKIKTEWSKFIKKEQTAIQ